MLVCAKNLREREMQLFGSRREREEKKRKGLQSKFC